MAGAGAVSRGGRTSCTSSSTRWPIPARADELDALVERFGDAQARFDELGGYALERAAREILAGLGFAPEVVDGDVGASSRAAGRCASRSRASCSCSPTRCCSTSRPTTSTSSRSSGSSSSCASFEGALDHDLARSRVHEPPRHARSSRSTAASSPATPATTTSTSGSARCATRSRRRSTSASRRCSPRKRRSSRASRRARATPRRCSRA